MGYSKERRVDPQIVVGLLVDASGFPLEIACYEGNKAETATIIPVLTDFQTRNQVADMVVVADAGMLSGENLQAIADADLRFIVGGSRMTKAPYDLAKHFRWHGDSFVDGQIIDTVTTRGRHQPDPARVNTRQEPVWNAETDATTWRRSGSTPANAPSATATRWLRKRTGPNIPAATTGLSGQVLRPLWTLQHVDRVAAYFFVVPLAPMVMAGPEVQNMSPENS